MKLEIDIPYYVFEQIKRENTIKNVLNRIDFAIRNGEERPHGEWGKWVISEVRCPECLEYFDTDCFSKEEMNKCPNCGADMRVKTDFN